MLVAAPEQVIMNLSQMSEQHMVVFFLDIFVLLHFFYGDMTFRTNTDGLLRRISTFSKQLVFKFKTQTND